MSSTGSMVERRNRSASPTSPTFSPSLAKKILTRWRASPVRFFREVLGIEPWERQRELLETVAAHDRVAVRSGHKVGKSTSAAGLALWWMTCFEESQAILTSASSRQVRAILWREVRALHRRARFPIGGLLHDLPELGLQFEDGRQVSGFSTNEPERFGGIAGRNLLFLLDEASGIPEPIYEALEGNRAGGARVVLLGNPTRTSGTFYEAFHGRRAFYETRHISSEESPNVVAGRIVIPGLATAEWVQERRDEWGAESPLYQVRVAGNFPTQAENAIIALVLVEDATARWEDTPAEGRLELGVDVARFGDDETVIYPRRGRKAFEPIVLRSMDSIEVAGKVLQIVRSLRIDDDEKPKVKVDVVGVGAGVADHLKRSPDVETIEVNVAESPTATGQDARGYATLRDQLWFALRDWLKDGGAMPSDPKLEAELVAPTYTFDTRGRVKVEAKPAIKQRLHRSPDRADALALAVYEGDLSGEKRYGRDYGIY